jgi:hypothetical protein
MHPYSHAHAHHTHMRPTDHQQFTSDFMLGEEHQTSEKQIESSRRAAGRGDGDGRQAGRMAMGGWAARAGGDGPWARGATPRPRDCGLRLRKSELGCRTAGRRGSAAGSEPQTLSAWLGLAWLGLGGMQWWLAACVWCVLGFLACGCLIYD